MNREDLYRILIDHDILLIETELINNNFEYIKEIFANGIKGYKNSTKEELILKYKEYFGKSIEILN